ncbi:hypothetical protein GH714_030504 [Hevea brasiliensis]|uniref:Major facilitator superfamily (MFS) profile domain-containing protein n=1 Tax=Hevea brasiliensis TaxID=3981 RepID=A0A6A6N520_HEVBR|nr:hypothetical protein GH714_030504 [Hevea brasiliensis]
MAGGVIVSATAGKDYPGNLTLHVFITCVIAATGGLIFGYDLGISGGVISMDDFLKKFFPAVYRKQSLVHQSVNQYCAFDSQILTLFTSSLYLAALVSSIFASYITRKLGRRVSMVAGGVLFAVGAILNGFAQNLAMLIIGRLLLGFGVGSANQSVPIYLSEVAPHRYRGGLNMMFQLSITIGILVADLLNYFFAKIDGWGWRLSLGIALVPALIIIIGSFFLPETPNSLIERDHHEKAKEKLIELRGVPNVDEEFNDLITASEAAKLVKNSWRNIIKRQYRPHLVMAICIPMFQQLTGMNVIVLCSCFVQNHWLQKPSFPHVCFNYRIIYWTTNSYVNEQLVVALAIGLKFGVNGNPGDLPTWYAVIVVILICIFVAGYAWSWGPLGWLVPSEIFPLEIRSAAQSITVSVNMIFTFIIAQVFTAMLCHMKFGLFLFFAFFIMVMGLFIYYLLPETKGVPIEEMITVWKNHPYWRKYYDDLPSPKQVELA